jgi:DNA repair exonuclease SbcCD ATPase subunit
MKIYNCEECGFSTKYKNRIKYHINVRRKCGIENINFKRECDDNNEQDKSDKYSEIIDTINKKQTELDEQEQALKSKEETISQREIEINKKILRVQDKLKEINANKQNEYTLALSREPNRNLQRGFTFV